MMKIIKNIFSNRKKIKKYKKQIKDTSFKIKELEKEKEELLKRIRDPNYADLMRDNLGSLKINLTDRNPFYLDGISEEKRMAMITQANEIYKNEMFETIVNYLINAQGNYILKEAQNDVQIFAGRFNINGLTLFRKEVERCHVLFEEIINKEDFNKFDTI